jgi:hypothetical protein
MVTKLDPDYIGKIKSPKITIQKLSDAIRTIPRNSRQTLFFFVQ